MAQVQQLTSIVQGISCHAWNGDRTMVAISPNNNEIHIYNAQTWTVLYKLTEHDMLVSSIDWSPVTNKIVSCSHDRNAFVWTFEPSSNSWKPSLVMLKIDRAALNCKWSSDGKRFAVSSAAKCICVCSYYEPEDWWVCKFIKKKVKTTTCVDFHPTNGQLLAAGGTDFKCRVFSTYAVDVDGDHVDAGPFTHFGGPMEFGTPYVELSASSWVNAVAWSPSGKTLAFASHDSVVHFASMGVSAEPPVQSLRLRSLPFTSIVFLSDDMLVGVGHDFNPALLVLTNGIWAFDSFLDKETEKSSTSAVEDTNTSRARELFRSKTVRGQDAKLDSDVLKTKHDRLITQVCNASTSSSFAVDKISTIGMDGKLVSWDLPVLNALLSKLRI